MNFSPPDQIAFYVVDFRADLCFSILEFVWNLLDYYHLCLAQLVPNSIWLIISFFLLCRLIPTNPRPSLFRAFFIFCSHPKSKVDGFSTRRRVYILFLIFHCPFIDGRTNFFISSSSSWGFPSFWSEPKIGPNEHSRINIIDRKDFLWLKDMKVPVQRELMTEQALYDVRLSSMTFLDIA